MAWGKQGNIQGPPGSIPSGTVPPANPVAGELWVDDSSSAPPLAAGAVTVDPTGLVVATTTNVQAALAQLDAQVNTNTQNTKFGTGTIGSRPTPVAYGVGWYFANDDNGGALYHSDGTTWTKQAPGLGEVAGVELGYAELTTSPAITSTTAVDLPTPLSITVNVGSRPVLLEAYAIQPYISGAVGSFSIYLVEGTTALANCNLTANSWGVNNILPPVSVKRRLAPSAGAHTYKVQALASSGSTLNLYNTGVAGVPSIWLRAVAL